MEEQEDNTQEEADARTFNIKGRSIYDCLADDAAPLLERERPLE